MNRTNGVTMQEAADALAKIGTNGVTMQEAADALAKIVRRLPPIGEEEIKMIKSNQSLSIIQKWLLIRKIKRMM